jgi:hypothetical protein
VREDGSTDAKLLVDALTLYNDFRYSREAGELKAALGSAQGKEREDLQTRYNAIVKNIQAEVFKPK